MLFHKVGPHVILTPLANSWFHISQIKRLAIFRHPVKDLILFKNSLIDCFLLTLEGEHEIYNFSHFAYKCLVWKGFAHENKKRKSLLNKAQEQHDYKNSHWSRL